MRGGPQRPLAEVTRLATAASLTARPPDTPCPGSCPPPSLGGPDVADPPDVRVVVRSRAPPAGLGTVRASAHNRTVEVGEVGTALDSVDRAEPRSNAPKR